MGDIPLKTNFVREVNHPLARRRCILWHFNRCLLTGETNLQQQSTAMFFQHGKQHWYLRHHWPTLQRGLSAIAEREVANRQTDKRRVKHYLPGGGKKCVCVFCSRLVCHRLKAIVFHHFIYIPHKSPPRRRRRRRNSEKVTVIISIYAFAWSAHLTATCKI